MDDVATLREEIALLREENAQYAHSIMTLVIGANVDSMTEAEIIDYGQQLVDACRSDAARIVDRRHG